MSEIYENAVTHLILMLHVFICCLLGRRIQKRSSFCFFIFLGRRLRLSVNWEFLSCNVIMHQCKFRIVFLEGDYASVHIVKFASSFCLFIIFLEGDYASVQIQICFLGGRLRFSANCKVCLHHLFVRSFFLKGDYASVQIVKFHHLR